MTIKEEAPCRKSLHIEVPAEAAQQRYTSILSEYKKHAKIPGFRPGKAPQALVEKRYAKEALKELKERMIPEYYQKAIEQEKIQVATVLNVTEDELAIGHPFSYTVLLDTVPVFELSDYRGIGVKAETHGVTDEDVDGALKQLLERFASYDEVTDRAIQEHDVAQVSYEATCDGEAMSGLVPEDAMRLAQSDDSWIACDENEFLPGLGTGLIGGAAGEEKEVRVSFAEDFVAKEVAGKEAVYRVKIKAIRSKNIPALDEEMLKKLSAESEEQLRTQLRGELEQYSVRQEEERRKSEIISQLLAKYSFDLPESDVQEETRELVYEMVRNNTMRGVKDEEITENKGQIFEAATKTAEERVRLHYVMERIADQEKITVSRNEVDAYIRRLAQAHNMSVEQATKRLNERNGMAGVRDKLRQQKTVEFLLKEAKIEE
ncbi:MAG: trigger factor [Kiritimatiellae bacterium]|nr:trigger factor [Kiritimatiellia bacterium]